MIISIASQKGGTGKTTSSITLSAGVALRGKKVLLIDMDSQANSSKVLLHNYREIPHTDTVCETILRRKPLIIHKTFLENVDLVPSHILLSETDMELALAKDHRESRLKDQLEQIKGQYDHVIIDCPPALSWLTLNAFTASDKVMIVVSPGYFELDSIVQLGKTLEEVREYFNPSIDLLGLLFTMSDPTVNSATSLDTLRKQYGDKLLKTVIPRNTDIRDAHMNRKDIFSFNPQSKSAQAYERLIEEINL